MSSKNRDDRPKAPLSGKKIKVNLNARDLINPRIAHKGYFNYIYMCLSINVKTGSHNTILPEKQEFCVLTNALKHIIDL